MEAQLTEKSHTYVLAIKRLVPCVKNKEGYTQRQYSKQWNPHYILLHFLSGTLLLLFGILLGDSSLPFPFFFFSFAYSDFHSVFFFFSFYRSFPLKVLLYIFNFSSLAFPILEYIFPGTRSKLNYSSFLPSIHLINSWDYAH